MITFPRLGQAGRLGNQLFQIAGTIGIANAIGDDFCFPHWDYEPYFRVRPHWFTEDPYGDDATIYADSIVDERAKVYLQDYGLWKDVKPLVYETLQPTPLALMETHRNDEYYMLPHPLLVMHVRRGDNATSHLRGEEGYHPLRPTSYYREAIEMLEHKSLAIFSDDLNWCREEFKDLDAFFFKGGESRPKEHEPEYRTAPVTDWIDLVAMTHGDAFIMSNSTYSWWSAFLSGVPGSQIIYPWPFMGPKLKYINCNLLFPPDWTRLEHAS